jgi:hypothetical protein
MGTTAAWVFMGIFILVLDLVRDRKINPVDVGLLKFWEKAIEQKEAELTILKNIDSALRSNEG